MPADKAIKIIRSIFESNKMVDIIIEEEVEWFPTQQFHVIHVMWNNLSVRNERSWTSSFSLDRPIKIQIIPIIPKYEINDRVLILSTGEIGEVKLCDSPYFEIRSKEWYVLRDAHWSEIAKLPNDL